MDVSVIIVNYNTKELTKNCIDSVFARTSGVSFEVILVDNASTDGSVELFEKDDRIQFIESEKNLGFGKANNLGYQYSNGKYVFLLNSDTLLLNNAIKMFYDKMESIDGSIGCMGCLLEDADRQFTHSYADFPKVSNLIYSLVSPIFRFLGCKKWELDNPKRRTDGNHQSFFQVDYITGADLFIRRHVIEECGLFDPDFFMYYEDSEMQHRYFKKGYKSYIYVAPKIMHLEGCSMKPDRRKSLISFDSQLKYLEKTQPQLEVFLIRVLLFLKLICCYCLQTDFRIYYRSICGLKRAFK